MEYTYNDIKELIESFCLTYKTYCYVFECNDLYGQAIYEFERCIMGISFGELDWGPYYMTSIEIRSYNEKVPATHKSEDLVYFFYDSRENTFEDIKNALLEAYKYGFEYDDSMLGLRINEKCSLTEDWMSGLHPDDADYSRREDVKEYTCVGTFAQYYILNDGEKEFRMLGKFIQWV